MKSILTILAVTASLGLGWGVYRYSTAQAELNVPPVKKMPVAVEVMVSARRPMADRAELVGSLQAGGSVQILARRDGYVTKLPFDVGDAIQLNDVIVELDDRELTEMVAGANAALVVAEAQKKAQDAQAELAQTELARQQRLMIRDAGTRQSLEQAEAQWKIAVAQRELEAARVNQAQSELDRHELALTDSKILAPIAGVVAERFVDIGDLAKPDVPLLRIVSFETVRTFAHVVEIDYPRVKVGQHATIHVDAFPHAAFQGQVIRKSPILNPNTRTAAVQIEIPNADRRLKPGMHARVSLVFERREATVVPIAALMTQENQSSVFIIEADPPTIRRSEVQTGIREGAFVEILSGISPTDRIVTLGSRLVQHGQVVNPVAIAWPKLLDPQTQTVHSLRTPQVPNATGE